MHASQKEIRSTVSVNMFEISYRKIEEEGEVSSFRQRKGRAAQQDNNIIINESMNNDDSMFTDALIVLLMCLCPAKLA